MTPKLRHLIGLTAIVMGAFATFDAELVPVVRYLFIYLSMLTITGVVLYNIYTDVDQSPTLDKVKEKL